MALHYLAVLLRGRPTRHIISPRKKKMSAVIRDISQLKAGDDFTFRSSEYKVLACIFQGPFSSVYKLMDPDGNLYAMKLESKKGYRDERPVLKMDVAVLRSLSTQPGFVTVKDVGRNVDWKTLMMKFVGPDLQRLQNLMPERRFTLPTAYHIALEVLDRLDSLHRAGYLHRDLKAANFAVGLDEHDGRRVYMLDFGMCRKYRDAGGRIQLRKKGPICGTIPFSSMATNCMEDMAPRDDLENWFFMSLHMIKGRLPWYHSDEEGPHFGNEMLLQVREWKRWCLEVDRPAIFGDLPIPWQHIHNLIKNCRRDEPAPIDKVRRLLKGIVSSEAIDISQPLDWQVFPQLRRLVEQAASREIVGGEKSQDDQEGA